MTLGSKGKHAGADIALVSVAALTWSLSVAQATAQQADDGSNIMVALALGWLLLFLLFSVLYVLPTIVAFQRGHPNRWPICVINFCFGATGIGWFGSLIWACSAVHISPGSNGGESGLNLFANDPRLIRIEPVSPPVTFDDISAQLMRLKRLHETGALTAEEYSDLKRPLIAAL